MIKFNSILFFYVLRTVIGLGNFIILFIFFEESRKLLIEIAYLIQLYVVISEGLINNLYSKTDRFSVMSIIKFSTKYRLIFLIPLSLILTFLYQKMNNIYFLMFFFVGFTNYENLIQFIDLDTSHFKELIFYRIIATIIAVATLFLVQDVILYYTTFILLTNLSAIKPIFNKIRCQSDFHEKDNIRLNLYPLAQSLITYSYTSLLILSNTNLTGWANFGLVDKIYNSAINFLSPLKFAQGINFTTRSEWQIIQFIIGLSLLVLLSMAGLDVLSVLLGSEINFQGYLYIYLFVMCVMGLVIPQLNFKLNYYNKEKLLFFFILALGIINIPLNFAQLELPLRLVINSLFIIVCLLISSYRLK